MRTWETRAQANRRISAEVTFFANQHPLFHVLKDEMVRLMTHYDACLTGAYRVAYYRKYAR